MGRSAGRHKNTQLVMDAISQIPINLNLVKLFHSDREKESDNYLLCECLKEFGMQRSLNNKRSPYDDTVAEATFKTVKTEFVSNTIFDLLKQLRLQFNHYVDWFNDNRFRLSLNYQSLIEYKMNL
uniref:IS3 family transposase n=1 Tax=Gilliamella sp. Nev6-6 TaxID=3120252 RepID=UPI0015CF42A8|nr:IS3 family transposase [Gilliamella apicola]